MNLQDLKNTTLLLFGKPRAFNAEEFTSQLAVHKIELTTEINDAINVIVEGRMMTPYEQNSMEALYESGKYEFISIDELETLLAETIDANVLLMSLKLSRNKERLKSFIQNNAITDELFFKLLGMYSWGGEDFFENDENRDVSAAFILRFYENIERNHNVQYATTGFSHLVTQAKSNRLLSAIASLEPIQFHPDIEAAIALSPYCDEQMQEQFFKQKKPRVLAALSRNARLSRKLVEEFLKEADLAASVAKNIALTQELFELLQTTNATLLALNETLSGAMQKKLLEMGEKKVHYALCLNHTIDQEIAKKLLEIADDEMKMALYENSATPQAILEEAYKDEKFHGALAKNENTPVEILYQLQLDGRYERAVKTNAAFGRHIQSENIGWLV
jgi:hypothetical protein